MEFKLERPDVKYKDSFLAALHEMESPADKSSWISLGQREPHDTPAKDFKAYVDKLLSSETEALPGFVTQSVYWAVAENGEVVGRIVLRHELNENLEKLGGHIGYVVRPLYRGQGVASEMLRKLLLTDRAQTYKRLLILCDEGNTQAEKTILKNRGIFEGVIPNGNRPRRKRYWITPG